MSKKDTIIIAVLINLGLLAILFMMAKNTSGDAIQEPAEVSYTFEEKPATVQTPIREDRNTSSVQKIQMSPQDELDDVLENYGNQPQNQKTAPSVNISVDKEMVKPTTNETVLSHEQQDFSSQQIITVIVKKGDVLERIARLYGTSVEEVKRANHLTSERLDVGQVLRIPVSKAVKAANTPNGTEDMVFYTIKTGDNPWKIARQYKVRYEDILKLNNLDETKARNLKVGDRIRVK